MQHRQSFSKFITVLVVLSQVLASISGVLPANVAYAAPAAAPVLAQTAQAVEAAAPTGNALAALERTAKTAAVAAPGAPERAQAETRKPERNQAVTTGPELARPSAQIETAAVAPAIKPLAAGGPASISGLVYSNLAGVKDTGDSKVGGVIVTAYDAIGAVIASTKTSTVTATLGQYTLSNLPANTPLRLEFTNLPSGYYPTSPGSSNGTSVQFVTTNSGALGNVNFGILAPVNYCQSDPLMGASVFYNTSGQPAFRLFHYDGADLPNGASAPATQGQVGAVWGATYQRSTHTVFVSAASLGGMSYGPQGKGGIYAINISNPSSAQVTPFINLTALGIDVGANVQGTTSTLLPGIGKTSLGDIAISDDDRTLNIMNVYQRTLVQFDTKSMTITQQIPVPDPGCLDSRTATPAAAPQDRRPWGVTVHQGEVYVGVVCSGETSQLTQDLHGYILRLAGNQFVPFFDFTPIPNDRARTSAPWIAWKPDSNSTWNTTWAAGAQPLIGNFEFADDGSLIIDAISRYNLAAFLDGQSDGFGYENVGSVFKFPFVNGQYSTTPTVWLDTVGGTAVKPGSGEFVYSYLAHNNYYDSVAWQSFDQTSYSRTAYLDTGMRKGSGTGDLEIFCDPAPIEIGNRVWKDTNGNGIQDADEPGLAGVVVSLYDSNNNRLATVATDAQGAYYFSNATGTDTFNAKYNLAALKLNTSGYQVRIDTTQPALANFTLTTPNADSSANGDARDSDGQMSGSNAIATFATSVAGANNHTYDLGFKFTGVGIGNYVWKDNNADGLQDATDTPLAGVTVGLYQSNGNLVMCVQNQMGDYLDTGASTTDSAGSFNWAGQAWTFTSAGITTVGNPGNTVYVNGNGTATRAVDLSVFGSYPVLSYDFAYLNTTTAYSHTVEYSTDSGVTWQPLANHTSNSGVTTWQSTSYVLPTLSANARIRIRGGAGTTYNYLRIDNLRIAGGIASPVTTVTDAHGHYGFDSTTCVLPSTQYQVRIAKAQDPLVGLSLVTQDAGGVTSNDPTGDDSDSDAASATISNTVYARILATSPVTGTNNSYDFGFTPVEIGNYVWKDLNTDGVQDSGEPGIPGVTVGLYDASGNQVQCTQVGRYDTYLDQFSTTGNTNSNGTLDWSSQAWAQTNTSISASSGNPGGSLQVYGSGTNYYATRPVDLAVFAGNPTLRFDYNMAGTASKFNIQYSSNGGTSFTTLATLSDNNNGYKTITYTLPITVASAQIRIQGFGTGGGTWAYFDNLTIRGQVRYPVTTVTDADGLYTFTGANCVQPGTNYQVRLDMTQNALVGLFLTTQNAGGVTSNSPTGDDTDSDASKVTISGKPNAVINAIAPAAGVNYSYDFGFVPVEIGNYVWKDTNINGLQDSGEPGIANVTVGLYDSNGNPTLCTQASTANLALNQTATQSSLYGAGYEASKAVDGNTATGESITQSTANSWWQVDLGQSAVLRQVVIYPRPDGYHTQTEQIYVEASNQPFASTVLATTLADPNVWHSTLQGAWTGTSLTVAVPAYTGRYVRIQHNNTDYLSLGEVQVFGEPSLPVTTITDASGHYTFTGVSCLQPSTGYQVRIATNQMALRGLYPTTPNAGGVTSNSPTGDDSDSDATSITISNTVYARTALTTPVAGVNYSYDFGFVPVEIGNYVWKDTNTNGVQDSGEPGIPGVTLNLYRNGNPVVCVQDQTAYYLDTGVGATDSAGSLDWAGQAWTFSSAGTTSGGNPGNAVYIYGNGTATRAVDLSVFGGYPTVSYDYAYANTATGYSHIVEYSTDSGVTWQTAMTHTVSSGVTYQSASFTLPSLSANARLRIRGAAGTTGNYLKVDNLRIEGLTPAPATTVTDSDGHYSFDGRCVQPNTTYQVRLDTTQPAVKGLYVTTPNAGGVTSNNPTLDDTDADAITTTLNYKTWAVINATAPAVGVNPSYDFGFVDVGIGNYVWKDTNNDGHQDSGEPVMPELALSLYHPNGTPVMCVYGKSGYYLDTGAGVTDSAGTLNWANQAWTFSNANTTGSGNPGNTVYIYGNGTATRAVDLSVFGEYPTISYDYAYVNTTTGYSHVVEYSTDGGTTWQTLATYSTAVGTAYQSASFTLPSLSANARIRIRGAAGTTGNYLRIDNLRIAGGLGEPVTTFTDLSGYYSFTGADCVQPNGQYQVRMDRMQALLRGLYLTTPNAGGVTSNDPTLDDTDSDAISTTISGMPYAVINATAPAAGINPSYDFGFVEVGIGNYVWRDTNTDGVQDANEPGIAGVTVGLYDANGNPVMCVQDQTKYYLDTGAGATDSAGTLDWSGKAWTFTSAGITSSGNPGNTVYVYGNGTATRAIDLSVFGTYPTISYDYAYVNTTTGYSHVVEYSTDGGTTWQTLATYSDSAGTAYQSVSFTLPTISANARIRIRGAAGTTGNYLRIDNLRIEGGVATPATTVTDGDGHYGFDGRCVQPNTQYQVRIDTLQDLLFGLYLTTQNAGSVTSNDPTLDDHDSDASTVVSGSARNAVINLTSPVAGINNSYDFGFIPVEIGNYVWKDNNTNGRQDSGEPGIAGVTVGLYDSNGNQVLCPQVGVYDTYADAFNSGVSNGSTGSLTWGATWSFAGSAAAYSTGGNPSGSMYVYGVTTSTAARTVDLSVFARPPTLSFDYIRGNGAASFNVQYSSNGGASFTTLASLNVNNTTYQTITYTLPITAANAQIRVQGATGSGLYAYFDNFTIRGQQRFPMTTATDSNGFYSFTGAQCVQPSTNYQVRIDTTQDPLVGLYLTGQNAGGVTSNSPTGDDSDSDASMVTISGKPNAVISLTAPVAGVNYSYDFGFIPVEIGNYVWKDNNTNGRQDAGEPPIPGVTVGLYDASGNAVQCTQVGRYDTYQDQFSTTGNTNSNGTLDWSGQAWVLSNSPINASTGNPGGALQVHGASTGYYAARPVDLSVFAGNPTLRFDYNMAGTASKFNIQYSSNGGTSFTTLAVLSDNNNGYKTITYTLPITAANAQIRIQGFGTGGGSWAYFDNLTIRGQVRYPVTTVTDSNGLYTFTGAQCVQPSASYQVRIDTTQDPLVGLFLATQNAGGVTSNDPTGDDSDSDASMVTISGKPNAVINATAPAAGVNYSYDFGFVPVEIGNYVWRDDNTDGLQDSGEPGIAGVTVGLSDNSGNAVLCTQSSTANLALNQTATQSSLYAAGYEASKAVDGNTASGESISGSSANSWWQVDLGQSAVLRQVVIYARPDGFHTQTEQIYVEVSDQPFASTTLATTLADPNVWHSTLQGAWTGASLTVAVPNYTGRYVRIQHSNTDYMSLGEAQVFGNPSLPVTTVTDVNGHYTFTGAQCVQPSTTYQVRIDTTQSVLRGLFPTSQNAGGVTSNDPTSDDTDSDAAGVTVNNKLYAQLTATSPAAGVNYSYDFGFVPVIIGNYVWKDANADGLQTTGEPAFSGVTVGLYDSSGNAVQCTQVGRYDTYQDGFNTASVNSGSTGTLAWNTNWSQTNTAVIGTNGNPGGSLRGYGNPAYYTTRPVDLSVFAGPPTLRLDYNFGGAALSFAIQYSSDSGTTFQTLATLSGNNSTYKTITYTLPITAANAQIRIQGVSGNNYGYFDNITIQGQRRYPVTDVTDANGLYTFSGAECLEPSTPYQVRIDTTQNALFGFVLTTPNAGGVTSNSPTGDDSDSDASGATINGTPYAVISLTSPAVGANYSYDFGFVSSPVGSLRVNKTVNGATAPAGWRFTLSSANCALPPSLTNPITTTNGAGGFVTFANLLVKDGSGAACQYQVTEKSQTGWFLNYVASDLLTGIKVTANSTTPVSVVNNQPQTCNAGSGNVGGLVFQDFNMDGQQNSTTNEPGFTAGVIAVRAYGKNNQLLASVPLQPDGSYVFTNLPNLTTDGVRIEFQNLTAAGVEPTSYTAAASTANRVSKGVVRFVNAATCNADLGVNRPVNYCQVNPKIAMVPDNVAASNPSLVEVPYTASGAQVNDTTTSQTGSIWGLAYQKSTNTIFMGAFYKPGWGFGPLGSGGIYAYNRTTKTLSQFVNLQTLGITTGPISGLTPVNDVGKVSLGDIDISEDGKTLYIMNMYQRELVLLDIATKSITQRVPVPDPGCKAAGQPAPQDRQPWGIAVHDGAAYVGITCSGETSGLTSDLHHYIMKLQGNTFVPFFDFPSTRQGKYVAFHAWVDSYSPTEPILDDFEFDVDGSLVLATSDRNGYKWDGEIHGTGGVGVLARACNVNGTLVFEGGAGCRASYYSSYGWGNTAGIALVPGTGEVVSNELLGEGNFQGLDWLNNVTGGVLRIDTVSQSYGKATGVGDVEALCDPAPLEIGNRVWNDSALPNGVQDPNEPGIAGVIVSLYNITGTLVATTTTNAVGEYYFNNANVTGGLKQNTDYTIRIRQAQTPLTNLSPTLLNQVLNNPIDPDEHDSDGNPATYVGYVTTPAHTGSAGQNDYSYDFGFNSARYDWGDDPDTGAAGAGSYNTVVTNTGAVHVIVPGLHLGATVDAESNGQPNTTASGDGADEDGVQFPTLKLGSAAVLTVTATNTGTTAATIYGWLDFNGDGQFTTDERMSANVPAGTTNGLFLLTYYLPVNAVSHTYARFRLSTDSAAAQPTGAALDGEVEDYPVTIQSPPPAHFGDRVWIESDTDGLASTGTITPVAGLTIVATSLLGTYTTTTNSLGYYSFTVLAGTYAVTYGSVPASYGVATPSATPGGSSETGNAGSYQQSGNSDQSHANGTTVTLTDGQANWHIDFAFHLVVPEVSIGNQVWVDGNDNGLYDVGEKVVPHLVMELWVDLNHDGIAEPQGADAAQVPLTTTTTASGAYSFTHLAPGAYFVRIPHPPPATPLSSLPVDAPDNGVDNDDNGSQPGGPTTQILSPVIHLAVGDEPGTNGGGNYDYTVDFGLVDPFIGNLVWHDTNNNGKVDVGEAGIPNVTLYLLYDADNNGSINGSETTPYRITQTDANGLYAFGDVLPGNYQVLIPASNFATGQPLAVYTQSSDPTDSADDQTDDDDNGVQASVGMTVTGPIVNLQVDQEPINSGAETGRGNTLDDGDDNNGDMTIDFGFLTPPQADLHLVKQVDKLFAKSGDTVVYTLVLTNNGPDAAANVQVKDLLPAKETYQSANPQQGTYNSNTGIWDVGAVPANSSITLTITVTVK
ncbi:MAG: SdrD B-like domain-containing protein [Caldilineaceae bacterium]